VEDLFWVCFIQRSNVYGNANTTKVWVLRSPPQRDLRMLLNWHILHIVVPWQECKYKHNTIHFPSMLIVSLRYNNFWWLGNILAGWTTYGSNKNLTNSWAWRTPTVVQAGMPIVVMACIMFFPESPRWLIAHDRREEVCSINTASNTKIVKLIELSRHLQCSPNTMVMVTRIPQLSNLSTMKFSSNSMPQGTEVV
jgi:hypothetical protein